MLLEWSGECRRSRRSEINLRLGGKMGRKGMWRETYMERTCILLVCALRAWLELLRLTRNTTPLMRLNFLEAFSGHELYAISVLSCEYLCDFLLWFADMKFTFPHIERTEVQLPSLGECRRENLHFSTNWRNQYCTTRSRVTASRLFNLPPLFIFVSL